MKRPKTSLIASVILALPALGWADPETEFFDFQNEDVDDLPSQFIEIEGRFSVAGEEENKFLRLTPEPLGENAVIFGESSIGMIVLEARFRSEKKRRTSPRFSLGAHGTKGFRLRLVPQRKQVELIKDETEQVATASYDWESGAWTWLKLSITPEEGETWKVEGWVWKDGEEPPTEASITYSYGEHPGTGKATLWGTPYSGFPIDFDDVKLTVEPRK
ncbi:MAG: hypothetical protein AAGA58_14810 [Verrucomicrobiota bacterium]